MSALFGDFYACRSQVFFMPVTAHARSITYVVRNRKTVFSATLDQLPVTSSPNAAPFKVLLEDQKLIVGLKF